MIYSNFNQHKIKLDNYRVSLWKNDNIVIHDIKAFVKGILNNNFGNEVLYNKRNKIILNKASEKGLLDRDLTIKSFNLTRKYDIFRFRIVPSKAKRSFDIAVKLKEIGINTPEPLMAIELRGKFNKLISNYYITDYIDYDYNLIDIIKDDRHPLRKQVKYLLPDIAKDIRKMHDAGIIHNDLHAGNILIKDVDKNPQFYYIDLNRARVRNSPLSKKLRMKDMARFELTDDELTVLLKNYDPQNYKVCLEELAVQQEHRQNVRAFKKSVRNFIS